MPWRARSLSVLLSLAAACGPARGASDGAGLSSARSVTSSTAAAHASSAPPGASAAAVAAPEPKAVPALALLSLTNVVSAPVHDVALGKTTKVVALGVDVWLGEDAAFSKLAPLALPTPHLRVFFGRDDRPRLMGHVEAAGRSEAVYLRWRDAAWKKAPGELGRLATGSGVLYGVLGHDDPEVVCKDGDACIVKRLTGWTTIALPPQIARIDLSGPLAWARAGSEVWRLSGESWVTVSGGATFERADGLWAVSERDVWIAEHASSTLHRWDGKSWSKSASPIEGPRALWASSDADLWVVGDGGAARWDGAAWTRAEGAPNGLVTVVGRGDLVWLGGAAGLFRGTRTR
ncbi:MAG: hypothetical protein IPG04_25385 [Polyangiaceae bacterium]|nr:hypothetical protein [Polyangiaceae bacterium]